MDQIRRQYDAQCQAILQNITELKHHRQIIQETSTYLKDQIQHYKYLTLKEEQALQQINSFIQLLQPKDLVDQGQDQDAQKKRKNHEQLARYQSQLVDQDKIINESVLHLPEQSLQKIETYFSQITEEQVMKMIEYGKETTEVLNRIEKTKEKYERIKDRKVNKSKSVIIKDSCTDLE